MIRVLLADDHELMRKGLRELLSDHTFYEVCGEAANGREAVELVRRLDPDVVVMDITMPELNGLEATRQIRKHFPRTEVLVYTLHESEKLVRDVFAAGARGYILKSDAARNLITALEAVSQHRLHFTSGIAETVMEGYLKGAAPAKEVETASNALSDREREVMQLLAEGKSNKEVAVALGISLRTVETHRAAIFRKRGFHSISELVLYAVRNQMINP